MVQQIRVLFSELIGTYFLVFCGTGAMIINSVTDGAVTHVGIAITFGLVVMALIYALGRISGAHINPAVTIGFAVASGSSHSLIIPYIIAQTLGAILASITLWYLFPTDKSYLGATLPFDTWQQAFILEILLTFLLMFVILLVANDENTHSFTPIAVGGVVLLEAMFAGPITGASMNPARSIGPALISGQTDSLWIYIAAPIIGAIAATFTWKFLKQK